MVQGAGKKTWGAGRKQVCHRGPSGLPGRSPSSGEGVLPQTLAGQPPSALPGPGSPSAQPEGWTGGSSLSLLACARAQWMRAGPGAAFRHSVKPTPLRFQRTGCWDFPGSSWTLRPGDTWVPLLDSSVSLFGPPVGLRRVGPSEVGRVTCGWNRPLCPCPGPSLKAAWAQTLPAGTGRLRDARRRGHRRVSVTGHLHAALAGAGTQPEQTGAVHVLVATVVW